MVPNPTAHVVVTADGAWFHPHAPHKASCMGSECIRCVGVLMTVKVLGDEAVGDARSLSLPCILSDGLQIQCSGEGREQQSRL